MTPEPKEKMQKNAEIYASKVAAGESGVSKKLRTYSIADFKAGAQAMYDELKPLVEWVDVNERLPEKEGHYFVKVEHSFPKNCPVLVAEFYSDNNTFYSESDENAIDDVKYWKKIEL